MSDADNAGQIAYWNEVAGAKWVEGQERLDALMAPLTQALLAAAAVRPGERIADVGCGCGDSALRCAEAAGPSGHVLAVDVSAPMLEHARSRERALAGAAPIDWRVADASAYAFSGDRDLLLSRFGMMFFADRAAAFANLRRALKPKGRAVFLSWRRHEEVEWMHAPLRWLAALQEESGGAAGDPHAPGPFSLGDAEATCRLLRDAGFHDIAATPVDGLLVLGATIDEAAALLGEHGPAAHVLREGSPALRAEAELILKRRLRDHTDADGVAMAAACWLYSARA